MPQILKAMKEQEGVSCIPLLEELRSHAFIIFKERSHAMKEQYKKLVEMVKKNVPDKELMEKLGLQSKATLKKMYYDALVEAGKIKDIITEKEAEKETSKARKFSIGKRGTMTLSKALLVDKLGFKEGDTFTVSTRKGSIILRKE
jgi:organic radical activating enzyme